LRGGAIDHGEVGAALDRLALSAQTALVTLWVGVCRPEGAMLANEVVGLRPHGTPVAYSQGETSPLSSAADSQRATSFPSSKSAAARSRCKSVARFVSPKQWLALADRGAAVFLHPDNGVVPGGSFDVWRSLPSLARTRRNGSSSARTLPIVINTRRASSWRRHGRSSTSCRAGLGRFGGTSSTFPRSPTHTCRNGGATLRAGCPPPRDDGRRAARRRMCLILSTTRWLQGSRGEGPRDRRSVSSMCHRRLRRYDARVVSRSSRSAWIIFLIYAARTTRGRRLQPRIGLPNRSNSLNGSMYSPLRLASAIILSIADGSISALNACAASLESNERERRRPFSRHFTTDRLPRCSIQGIGALLPRR
jgi:hypothetical protein